MAAVNIMNNIIAGAAGAVVIGAGALLYADIPNPAGAA